MAGNKDQRMPYITSSIDVPEIVDLNKSEIAILLKFDPQDLFEKLINFAKNTKLHVKGRMGEGASVKHDLSELGEKWDIPEVLNHFQDREESIYDLLNARGKYMQLERFPQLANGTIRLINFIILETIKAGRNIDTLIFLDKSARPGAFLFSQTWNELSKRSLIPSEVKKPTIKFLNYSAYDFRNIRSSAKKLLKMYFKGRLGSNIIVVDESWASRSSTQGAMDLIDQISRKKIIFKNNVIGVPNFPDFPEWYHNTSFSPIADLPLEVRVNAADCLDQIGETQLFVLAKLTDFEEKEFVRSTQVNEILKPTRGKKSPNQISSDEAYIETNRAIYYYIKSAGGLLSLPTDKEATLSKSQAPDRALITAHRRLLSMLANYTASHCELKNSQVSSSSQSPIKKILKNLFS